MMIEKHISALLYRYQCIIVPGFGAFLTEIVPCRFDNESQTFFPPEKKISFNIHLKHNDGLLANHIAQQMCKSHEEATKIIDIQVQEWKNKLSISKNLELKGIGNLEYNIENNLIFEPITNTNYLTTSFGLSAIIASQISRDIETPVIDLRAKSKNNFNFLKYAAVFAMIAGIGGIIIKNEYKSQINQETLALKKEVQNQIQNQIQQATFFIETPISPITLTLKEKKEVETPYHIVAGAFKSEENAIKAIKELRIKGFENASYLEKNKYGLYPVLYGSFAELSEAQNEVKKIRRGENVEAWILIQ